MIKRKIERRDAHAAAAAAAAAAEEEMIREYGRNAVFCALQLIMHKESDFLFGFTYCAVPCRVNVIYILRLSISNSIRVGDKRNKLNAC